MPGFVDQSANFAGARSQVPDQHTAGEGQGHAPRRKRGDPLTSSAPAVARLAMPVPPRRPRQRNEQMALAFAHGANLRLYQALLTTEEPAGLKDMVVVRPSLHHQAEEQRARHRRNQAADDGGVVNKFKVVLTPLPPDHILEAEGAAVPADVGPAWTGGA